MIRLENVGLHYAQTAGEPRVVLHNLDLELEQGEMRFLTGPSGSGKSSLLRLLFMALKPTSGDVFLFGRNVKTVTARQLPLLRRRMGVVFQDFRLLDHLTVFDNVSLPLRVAGNPRFDFEQDVLDLLEWVGLEDQADAYPQTLSGGEKQRAAIARAVVAKPELLLADEPTGSVDPLLAKRLLHLFQELNRLGTTVLLATHDEQLIRQSGHGVLRLQNGMLQGVL